MNQWLELSIDYANQRNYLDNLFRVYPTIPEDIREVNTHTWECVEQAFDVKDNIELIKSLLKLERFPIKDSYVAYLRRDAGAIERNPATIARLCGRLYEMGLDKIYERASEPKETNTQMGPMFRRWLNSKALGIDPVGTEEFAKTQGNALLEGGDAELKDYAAKNLNYKSDKGLDLVARFNGKYVIGEAKFLTDFGGHQNAQFNDGVAILQLEDLKAIPVSILDGVLYIRGRSKMHTDVTGTLREKNIMSSLVLREFLYQI